MPTKEWVQNVGTMAGWWWASKHYLGRHKAKGFAEKKQMHIPYTPRRTSDASMHSHHSHHSMFSTANPMHEPATPFQSIVQIKNQKAVRQVGKHKKVHVSNNLKRKVQKVLEGSKMKGHYEHFAISAAMMVANQPNMVNYYGMGGMYNDVSNAAGTVTSFPGWLFDVNFFLHAASCLWNNKGQGSGATTADGRYNTVTQNILHAANFAMSPAKTLEFMIESSKAWYRYKNLSLRPVKLTFYVCAPKRKSAYNLFQSDHQTSLFDYNAQTNSATCLDTLYEPYWNMANAANTDTQVDAQVSICNTNQAGLIQTAGFSHGAYPLFVIPQMFPGFKNSFKCEELKVTLEPGQEYELHIAGPAGALFDASKLHQGGILMNIQKWSRAVLVRFESDVVTNGSFTAGAPATPLHQITADNLVPNTGVSVEMGVSCKLSMPETVAATLTTFATTPAVSALTSLKNRRHQYVYTTNYDMTTVPLLVGDVIPQQPATQVAS